MKPTIHLTLETILRRMFMTKESIILQTELAQVPGFRTPCRVQIMLSKGKILAALVGDQQNVVSGQEALTLLNALGAIDWTLIPVKKGILLETPSETQPRPQPFPSPLPVTLVPRRLKPLSREQFEAVDWLSRSVFHLSDGRKDIAALARLLHQETGRISEILWSFNTWGVLSLEEPVSQKETSIDVLFSSLFEEQSEL